MFGFINKCVGFSIGRNAYKMWKIYFLSQLLVSIHGDNTNCLKRYCVCKEKDKSARCSYLSYIPKIPAFVETLILSNNYLPYITRETFRNVSASPSNPIKIKNLEFRENNSLNNLTSDAFKDLSYLEKLVINKEKSVNISSLKKSFQSLSVSVISSLIFEENGWKKLSVDFFLHLTGAKIETVSLSGNEFIKLNTSVMWPFLSFKTFQILNNEIVFIFADGLQRLEHLDLTANNIYKIPGFCHNNSGQSLALHLRTLILTDNAIRHLQDNSFKCLDKLQNLILDNNRLHTIENNAFSTLHHLHRLSINLTPQLRKLNALSFNSSSLRILQFVQNGFRFDKNFYFYDKIFSNLPNLKELDLTRNYLPGRLEHLNKMFKPLTNLTKLYLQATSLRILPDGLLQSMPMLETVQLSGNTIEKWNSSAFENLKSLRKFFISGNHIHIINKTSFPHSLLMSLEIIDLSNNRFWCTCAQKWFSDFLKTSNITKILSNWPWRYTCDFPEERKRLLLNQYNPTDADCAEWSPISTIIIIVASGLLAVFISLLSIFVCQANIRNFIYLLRVYSRKRKGFLPLCSSEDYKFDAFVVYCDDDRHWVHSILLQRMEAIGLKLCIRDRDFDVGESIVDNVTQNMNQSWKIIVVLSNNFTKCEWCQWEIDLAQERRRQHGKDSLALIMYREIDTHHMIRSIRSLLDTTPHLTYKEGFGEDLFWSAVVLAVTKPFNDLPTAVL